MGFFVLIGGFMQKLKKLEEKIGYRFKDKTLLEHAMRHSSYVNEKHMEKQECNERLEFLGDAVLELISSEFLFFAHATMPEGELTKKRASMVCEPALAFCAKDIRLGEFLLLGKGEEATGGRKRESVTSDAMEALIGAIYLDGGFASAKLFYDSKTILQEMIQGSTDEQVSYELLEETGPDHNKSFCTAVKIGNVIYGKGEGKTKKASEQEAAYQAILKLQSRQ